MPNTAMHIQPTVEEVNDGRIPKVQYIVTDLAAHLLQTCKTAGQRAPAQLVVALQNLTFGLHIFKRIIKNLKRCQDISCKTEKKSMKDDRFQKLPVSNEE